MSAMVTFVPLLLFWTAIMFAVAFFSVFAWLDPPNPSWKRPGRAWFIASAIGFALFGSSFCVSCEAADNERMARIYQPQQ